MDGGQAGGRIISRSELLRFGIMFYLVRPAYPPYETWWFIPWVFY